MRVLKTGRGTVLIAAGMWFWFLVPAAAEELWTQAAAYAAKTVELEAKTVEIRTWELDKQRAIRSESRMLFMQGPEGSITLRMAEEDGEPVSSAELQRMQRRMEKISYGSEREEVSPFAPDVQQRITYRRTNQTAVKDGRSCDEFRFTFADTDDKGKEILYRGKAWVERQSGLPVAVRYTLDPLPAPLSSFQAEQNYGYGETERWLLRSSVIEAKVRLLFVRKHFLTETLYSDYAPKRASATP